MSFPARSLLSVAALSALAACGTENSIATTGMTAPDAASADRGGVPAGGARFNHSRVCDRALPGDASCHSWIRVTETGGPLATRGPSGYRPADLLAAYG